MSFLDRLLGNDREPAPAPDDTAAARDQAEADALLRTAQELGEINADDAKYW